MRVGHKRHKGVTLNSGVGSENSVSLITILHFYIRLIHESTATSSVLQSQVPVQRLPVRLFLRIELISEALPLPDHLGRRTLIA